MNFYGFDWQQAPQYSRLFSPSVVNRGQQAYGQGMGQFKQFDPNQMKKKEVPIQQPVAAAPVQQSGWIVSPDGKLLNTNLGSREFAAAYEKVRGNQINNQLDKRGFSSYGLGALSPQERVERLARLGYSPYSM
jgi:hypothetical protein